MSTSHCSRLVLLLTFHSALPVFQSTVTISCTYEGTTVQTPLLASDHAIVRDFARLISERQERVAEYLRQVGGDAVSAELVRRELDQLAHIAEQVEETQNELDDLLAETQRPMMQLETVLATLPSKEYEPVYSLDEQQVALQALGVRVIANGRRWQLHCDVFGTSALVAET